MNVMPWGFGMGLFGLMWLVVPVLVVLLIVWAVQQSRPMHAPPPPGPPPAMPARETPLDILARRFASGEITAEEYQKARDLLQGGGGGSAPPTPPPPTAG